MDLAYGLNPEQYRTFSSWHKIVGALLALLLLLLWLFGLGPNAYLNCLPKAVASAVAPVTAPPAAAVKPEAAPAPAPALAVPPTGVPGSVVSKPAAALPNARIYFALDKHGLPDDTAERLKRVVAYLQANPNAKATISGFHDPSGSRTRNIELARNRALAVKEALEKAGVAPARLNMEKPVETTGTGDPAEARRVEVYVVP